MPVTLVPNPGSADDASSGADTHINYAGPPTENPPVTLAYIVVDTNGQQWQYYQGGWN
jgi:hypothetical protein